MNFGCFPVNLELHLITINTHLFALDHQHLCFSNSHGCDCLLIQKSVFLVAILIIFNAGNLDYFPC